jgi:hypothetical protein
MRLEELDPKEEKSLRKQNLMQITRLLIPKTEKLQEIII